MLMPVLKTVGAKTIVGIMRPMCFARFDPSEVWKSFMPNLSLIAQRTSSDLLSVAVYPQGFFEVFDAEKEFEKWAAVEVSGVNEIPGGWNTMIIPAGLYAVFHYKGSSTDSTIFQYIFGTWMPASGYEVDDRPHLEILGNRYQNSDRNSEEEIWIPVRIKPTGSAAS